MLLSRPPKAWMMTVLILAFLEFAAREANPLYMLPAMVTPQYEHQVLSVEIEDGVPCDICLVGSSRVREGIRASALAESLGLEGAQPGHVSNYGTSLSGLPESLAVIRRILEHHRPAAIMLGLSVHPFTALSPNPENAFMLWRFSHWWEAASNGTDVWEYLPVVLQAEADRWSYLHRYRSRPLVLVSDSIRLFVGDAAVADFQALAIPGGVTGARNTYQGMDPPSDDLLAGVSLEHGDHESAESYMDRLVGPGEPSILPGRWADLVAILRLCEESDVPLILVEVPLSRELREAFGREQDRFIRATKAASAAFGRSFVTVHDLGLSFDDADFREVSHLNRRGALKLSHALGLYISQHGLIANGRPRSRR